MYSAKFQGHRITFGIIYIFYFPRRLYLSSPCYAWKFDPIFCRQAKNNVQMDSAKFHRHRITFGVYVVFFFFFNFPRRYYLGSPCYAWNFDPVFCRKAKNNVQMDSAKFHRHRITFGIIYFFLIFRGGCTSVHHATLGILTPFFAGRPRTTRRWILQNFIDIGRRLVYSFQNFPSSALGEFFFVRGTCPGGWSGDLVLFFSGLSGAIRDFESRSAGALARWGGPGTWGFLSPSRGMRMGRSSLSPNFA